MAKTIGQLNPATTIANGDLFVIEQSSQTFKIAASVVRGGLVDADVDAAAAIVYSKLDLDDSIVAGDLTADAVTTAKIDDDAVTTSKLDDAAVTPTKLSQPYTLATSVASTSGTSIDFTGIPSWAKRITVLFSEVSLSGTSSVLVRMGTSGGIVSSNYLATGGASSVSGSAAITSTGGFPIYISDAAGVLSGSIVISNITGTNWIATHAGKISTAVFVTGGGSCSLGGAITQVRITTVNGTDTFDNGTINISYEG